MKYLTERQRDILQFIREFQRERGVAPTHREICDRFGFSSYGTVYKHLSLLEKKGLICWGGLTAGPWQYIEPLGGLSDARREHYEVHIPGSAFNGKAGEHLLTVRAYDRHDNVGLAKTEFPTTSAPAAK